MADPAPSEYTTASSRQASSAGNASFANTRQHVADREADDDQVERFANTKLNIALINDPKNGPRFTLTKRESGLKERDDELDDADKQDDAEASATSKARPDAQRETRPAPDITRASCAPRLTYDDKTARMVRQTEISAEPQATQHARASTASDLVQAATITPDPALPTGVPPAAEPSDKVPVDSSKTFVGQNGTYYDESWRWMDWQGTRRSWNWPAALSFGYWFAYRRLYGFATLYLLALITLVAATVNDVPILPLIALGLAALGLAGVYGNILYFHAFRRAVTHVTKKGEGSYDELNDQLAAAGGTSVLALGIMAATSLAGIAATLAMTLYLRSSFTINLWPF